MEALKKENIPTIIVLTKHGIFPEFREEVTKLAPMADAVISVRAFPMPGFPDNAGLPELVEATFRLLPNAVQSAFASAQNIDFEMKAADLVKS